MTTRRKLNAAQDDEQHNTALRQRNHKKHKRENLIYVKSHLFRLKEKGKKYLEG